MVRKGRYSRASSRIGQRARVKKVFNISLIVGLPTAILVGTIFLARADFLQVASFEVVGTEPALQSAIALSARDGVVGHKLLVVPKSNIVLVSKKDLRSELLSRFTRFSEIEVDKSLFSQKITLKVSERKPEFWWCAADETCFAMSKDGLVFEKVVEEGAQVRPLIFRGGIWGDPLLQNFATPERMTNFLAAIDIFKKAGFEVDEIDASLPDKAIFHTTVGRIFLNPEEDLSVSTPNAVILMNDVRSKNPSAHFDYVDARFGNKVFYKLI